MICPFTRADYLFTAPNALVDCAGDLAGIDMRAEDYAYFAEAMAERKQIDKITEPSAMPETHVAQAGTFISPRIGDLMGAASEQDGLAAGPFLAAAPTLNSINRTSPTLPAMPAPTDLISPRKAHVEALYSRLDYLRKVYVGCTYRKPSNETRRWRKSDGTSGYGSPPSDRYPTDGLYYYIRRNGDDTATIWWNELSGNGMVGLLNPWYCDVAGVLSASGADQGHRIIWDVAVVDSTGTLPDEPTYVRCQAAVTRKAGGELLLEGYGSTYANGEQVARMILSAHGVSLPGFSQATGWPWDTRFAVYIYPTGAYFNDPFRT